MSKNIEKIDGYLKGVVLPEHISHQHRQQLRREVLNRTERRQTMSVRNRSWKYAAVVAIMICAGGIAVVGVNIGKYIYVGKDDAGVYIFRSEDAKSVVTLDDDEVTDVEQTRNDLQEIDILRQQDKRQLIRVNELFVNGKLDTRVFVYQYQLSDGRTMDMGEGDELNWLLDKKQREEWLQRKKDAGSGEDFGVAEKEFKGCMFVFKRQRFVLSEGTEIIWSVGTPK
jgi:hypothetical protein